MFKRYFISAYTEENKNFAANSYYPESTEELLKIIEDLTDPIAGINKIVVEIRNKSES